MRAGPTARPRPLGIDLVLAPENDLPPASGSSDRKHHLVGRHPPVHTPFNPNFLPPSRFTRRLVALPGRAMPLMVSHPRSGGGCPVPPVSPLTGRPCLTGARTHALALTPWP